MRFFLLILFFASWAWSDHLLTIDLFEKGTRLPLKEVTVYVLPDKLKGETDQSGRVRFDHVITDDSQVVISVAGYYRLEQAVDLKTQKMIELYLEKENYNSFETVVVDAKNKKDISRKTLTQKEFLSMPGANGDPLKAIQNLPGVNRPSGFSSQVIIQGSAPKDTVYEFEGHRIPIVFHFAGLSSVVMPEALEQVDYYSAGYDSERSRALGGVISLQSRLPEVKERSMRGLFYMDNLSAGGLFESRLDDDSSFLVSGRYSYIGQFLKKAAKNNESLNLTVAPEFQDITSIYQRRLSAQDDLKISLLGSRDRLEFVLQEPLKTDPSIRGAFSNTVDFFRLIPAWTHRTSADTTYHLSAGVGRDETAVNIGDEYVKIRYNILTTRAEWEYQVNSQWKSQLGLDDELQKADVDVRVPIRREEGGISNPISTSEKREAHIQGEFHNTGLYWKNKYAVLSNWDVMPGLRFDRFSQTEETFLLPRLSTQYRLDESWLFKAGTGLYVQPPEAAEASSQFGNPDIKSPQAVHLTFGVETDQRQSHQDGSVYSISYFDRWFDRLVIQSSDTTVRDGQTVYEVYNNKGRGRSYGVETQWKFYDPDYTGFISYTWSRSTRWNPAQAESVFQYDQTHNFNLVAGHEFSRNWKLSGRFRYVTGNPQTPVVGATYDADNEVYIPQRGALYSTRLKDFNQLDLRLDKKWVTDRSVWSVYLDIQNILNTKNPESLQYTYDYSRHEEVSGLPFLPAVGVKGEF